MDFLPSRRLGRELSKQGVLEDLLLLLLMLWFSSFSRRECGWVVMSVVYISILQGVIYKGGCDSAYFYVFEGWVRIGSVMTVLLSYIIDCS
jgi:hypothetical protein